MCECMGGLVRVGVCVGVSLRVCVRVYGVRAATHTYSLPFCFFCVFNTHTHTLTHTHTNTRNAMRSQMHVLILKTGAQMKEVEEARH